MYFREECPYSRSLSGLACDPNDQGRVIKHQHQNFSDTTNNNVFMFYWSHLSDRINVLKRTCLRTKLIQIEMELKRNEGWREKDQILMNIFWDSGLRKSVFYNSRGIIHSCPVWMMPLKLCDVAAWHFSYLS